MLRSGSSPPAANPTSDQPDVSKPPMAPSPAAPGPAAPLPAAPLVAIDLGSGGGLPGLVLAIALPTWRWTLLDGSVRRTEALQEAVGELGIAERTTVVAARAEEAARTALRGSFDVAVARGFAAAAPTAECAAPFLRAGGRLLVTEPPGGAPHRWPEDALAELGLAPGGRTTQPVAAQLLVSVGECPDRYPRRTGIPVKRPLW